MELNLLDKKLEYWEHQLLDLGKRNKMINYRETKRTTIKLVEPSFGELFNRLALNEETLTFQRSVDRETDIRVFSILSLLENLSASLPVTIGDIKTEGSVLERQRTLKNLRSKSRLALEEQGTNILYLSFGFIEWKDGKGASAQWIKSPLILVPAVLALEALNSPYTLKKHEDDIVVNPTLEYYLKTEYGIELPQFDADKDALDNYLKSLEEIADQRGWRVLREVSLGLLSFLKISMYNDLLRNEERIKKNTVIRAMAGDATEANEIPEHLRNFDLDSISTQDCYQVMSADSSQQDAILYSKNNISFVMQGPPGTGKSQTITNIIAEALVEGKKVLFVSEKIAALQVVYRRLQEAHLGDFCLPLHSYKANKKEILEQIGANLKLKQTRVKDTAITNLEELLTIRQELNQYASELHKLNPELNISCYEVYSKLEEVNDAPNVTISIENPLGVSQAKLQSYLNALNEYSMSLNRLNNFIKNNPWEGLSSCMLGYENSEKMRAELSTLSINLELLEEIADSISESSDLLSALHYSKLPEFADMLQLISRMPNLPNGWLIDYNIPQAISTAEEAKRLYSELFVAQENIEQVFNKGIYEYGYNEWKEKLLAIASRFMDMPLIVDGTTEFYIENVSLLNKEFLALKKEMITISTAFSKINDILGTNFAPNAINQQSIMKLLSIMNSDFTFKILRTKWISIDSVQQKELVSNSKLNADSIKINKERILSLLDPEFGIITDTTAYLEQIANHPDLIRKYHIWKQLLYNYANNIISLSFIRNSNADYLIDNCSSLIFELNHLKKAMESVATAFDSINRSLGTNFSANVTDKKLLSQLLAIIDTNIIFPSTWFISPYQDILILFNEAVANYKSLINCKKSLLSIWEDEVLLLDYKPMLCRYKTDYNSILKFFNKQYRKDRRQIQVLSKTVIKKPDDNTVINLLTELKHYHDLDAWFTENNDRLKRTFSAYYNGIYSDWDAIESAVKCKKELDELTQIKLSDKLISVLSSNHKSESQVLTLIVKEMDSNLEQINSICSRLNIPNILEISPSALAGVNSCIHMLSDLNEHALSINSIISTILVPFQNINENQMELLVNYVIKNRNEKSFERYLTYISDYIENISWFLNNDKQLKCLFSPYYDNIDSDWDRLALYVELAQSILDLFNGNVPEKLIDLLSDEHKSQTVTAKNLFSTINTSIIQLQAITIRNNIKLNFNSDKFDTDESFSAINAYLHELNLLYQHISLLKPYLNNDNEQIRNIYSAIDKLNSDSYADTKRLLSIYSARYKKQFDFLYTDSTTDWDEIIDLLKRLAKIKQSTLYQILWTTVNTSANRKKRYAEISARIFDIINTSKNSFEWVQTQFSDDVRFDMMAIETLAEKINGCLENIDILENWIDYMEAKENCEKNGLSNFIREIEDAEIYTDIERIFLKGFYHMWLGAVCDKSASLRRFRRNTHDERIRKFIELDDLQLLIAQMRIREKLIENLPSTNRMLKATDEVAILNKELSKKRNIMPLRKLFRLIPNLLMKLKPCLMMSPLSVSHFLETEAYHFDLVIFDEASQIFPEDAIGAIFRGSQVIIAGDSKQLPPTNFFSATTNNFDGDYDVSDEEDYSEVVSDSILEEAASVLPNRTLLWHYRSKHESLIAFSNREIYKNELITFPNSVTKVPDMGVEYIYVENGCYEGGGKNCNIREAQKCVMLVLEHIQKHPDRSIGIIAFSEKQQTAIENAIIDFRERMPQYEWFFDESKDEPFFVKNLENVQGDERDTIIFSICYAKDKNGKMYMRFGPLGHAGGERRLNVAITRAKCNVKLVGSILPSDIDLNRTNSDGVRMLRSYIEFARKGSSVLKPAEKEEAFETVDEFRNIVAEFLENNGYKVQKQVGCSDYKIDIAIENPDVDGEFIAGIECDGISYVRAKTARDRDHLRRTVLENMGWNLYRVWSTEWCRNPKAEGEALISFIQSVFDKNGNATHTVKQSNENDTGVSIDVIATEAVKSIEKMSTQNPYGFAYYKEANWWDTEHSGSHDNLTRISENILYIVSVEQPMHMELLYKRLGPSFKTGKATESVRKTIDEAISKKLNGRVVVNSDKFIRMLPLSPITVRIPGKYDIPRPMEFISTEEVAIAMIRIISNSFGITEEDLASECARVFGFERKGPKIKAKTDTAIKYLVDNGIVKIIEGKTQLMGE